MYKLLHETNFACNSTRRMAADVMIQHCHFSIDGEWMNSSRSQLNGVWSVCVSLQDCSFKMVLLWVVYYFCKFWKDYILHICGEYSFLHICWAKTEKACPKKNCLMGKTWGQVLRSGLDWVVLISLGWSCDLAPEAQKVVSSGWKHSK